MIINRSFSSSLAKEERFGSLKSLVLLVVIAILATSNTYAQASFETIDDLRYLIDSDAKTATLTANSGGEKYSGDIVVPEKVKASDGVEYPVTAFADNAFNNCKGLKSITIPSSVTSLGMSCFSASGLTSITIPYSVTSLGNDCFHSCDALTSITIPSSVTSLGDHCFYGCTVYVEYDILSSSNGKEELNLSKSELNNLSCITRYFSNSDSAKLLANSAETFPASCNTASPPASRIMSIRLAQSSIVIGMCRFAIRSAKSSTELTSFPISSSSTCFR